MQPLQKPVYSVGKGSVELIRFEDGSLIIRWWVGKNEGRYPDKRQWVWG